MVFKGICGVSVWDYLVREEFSSWLCLGLPSHGDDKKQTDSLIIVFMFSADNVSLVALHESNHSHPPCFGKYLMQCLAHSR